MFSSDVYIHTSQSRTHWDPGGSAHPRSWSGDLPSIQLPTLRWSGAAATGVFVTSKNGEKCGRNGDWIRTWSDLINKNWDGPKKLGADQQKWSFSAVDGGMFVSTCKTEVWTIKVTCYSSYPGLMMEFMGWADFHVWFKLSQEIGSLLSFNQVYTLW